MNGAKSLVTLIGFLVLLQVGCDEELTEFARNSLPNTLTWALSENTLHWGLVDMLRPQIVELDEDNRVVRTVSVDVVNLDAPGCRPYQKFDSFYTGSPLVDAHNQALASKPTENEKQLGEWNKSTLGKFIALNTSALFFVRDSTGVELAASAPAATTVTGKLKTEVKVDNLTVVAAIPTLRFDLVGGFAECLRAGFESSVDLKRARDEFRATVKDAGHTVGVRMFRVAIIGFSFGFQIKSASSLTDVDVSDSASNVSVKFSLDTDNVSLLYQQHGIADYSTSDFVTKLKESKDASSALNELRDSIEKTAVIAFESTPLNIP